LFLKDVTDLFLKNRIPFAIVGGYALALHGIARGTFDVDSLIRMKSRSHREQDLRDIAALEAIKKAKK